MLVFPVREPETPGLEIRVNFGMFAGREATAAEIEELASALQPEIGQVEIVAEHRFEFGSTSEAEVHQVRVAVPRSGLPADEFASGELAGRLIVITERWAHECIAERSVELPELV
ncbi:MAG TPA: hypothetical protein VJT84_01065 [Gaiellaceae bacterium]|nr:hypothetical protein [Gaiellaceae bacterium]